MRNPRILSDGATYHVYFRTNRSEFSLTEDWVKALLLLVVIQAKKRYGFSLQSLCIMSNHVHMVIRPLATNEYEKWVKKKKAENQKVADTRQADDIRFIGNLSKIMQYILGVFAQRYNRKLEIHGHFWGDRFKSAILASIMRFLRAIRYIDDNPVVAQLVQVPEDFQFGRNWLIAHGPPGLIDGLELSKQSFFDRNRILASRFENSNNANLADFIDQCADLLSTRNPIDQ
jgi:REP element-mobilizing transposase RayT